MRSQEIARRYAEALYNLSAEENCVEQIDNDYRHIVEEMKPIPNLSQFLTHPLVPREAKISFLREAFPNASFYIHNMLSILIRNGREDYISMIYDEFKELRGSLEGIVQVKITTAQELTPSDRNRLSAHLAQQIGGRVKLNEEVDRDLIGGLRIELKGKVLDGSLRARLNKLKTVIAG
jgi:F-type H+-transporting ATPase subunit delta